MRTGANISGMPGEVSLKQVQGRIDTECTRVKLNDADDRHGKPAPELDEDGKEIPSDEQNETDALLTDAKTFIESAASRTGREKFVARNLVIDANGSARGSGSVRIAFDYGPRSEEEQPIADVPEGADFVHTDLGSDEL